MAEVDDDLQPAVDDCVVLDGVAVPYVVVAYVVMAYIVMAHMVMAYIVMAYIVMAEVDDDLEPAVNDCAVLDGVAVPYGIACAQACAHACV